WEEGCCFHIDEGTWILWLIIPPAANLFDGGASEEKWSVVPRSPNTPGRHERWQKTMDSLRSRALARRLQPEPVLSKVEGCGTRYRGSSPAGGSRGWSRRASAQC